MVVVSEEGERFREKQNSEVMQMLMGHDFGQGGKIVEGTDKTAFGERRAVSKEVMDCCSHGKAVRACLRGLSEFGRHCCSSLSSSPKHHHLSIKYLKHFQSHPYPTKTLSYPQNPTQYGRCSSESSFIAHRHFPILHRNFVNDHDTYPEE